MLPPPEYGKGWRVAIAIGALIAVAQVSSAIGSERMPATGTVEIAFSPADNPEKVLLGIIGAARKSLHVHAYVFTSRTLASAMVEAHRRGVRVEVLADAGMNRREKGNAIPILLDGGVPVAFETGYAAAHNKVLIVDPGGTGCTVVTGSYNFTWSAQNRNAENVLVLRDNCPLVDAYLRNWKRHRGDAVPITRLPWTGVTRGATAR